MKNLSKNLVLFISLVVLVSFMVGCPGTDASKADINSATETAKDSESEVNDLKYPPAPEVIANADIELIDGSTFNLKESKGKVVLINLWATWCGPCIKEMPHLNEMEENYKDKDFMIVGLNTDKEAKDKIDRFIAKQELNYAIGWVERPVLQEYFNLGQRGGIIPQSFLFNRNGELTGVFQGGSPKVISQMKEHVEKIVNSK